MSNKEKQLNHIAIIPDGNRRWAKSKGLLAWQGHMKAGEKMVEVLKHAFTLGIPYVTIWGGSYDNLTKRDKGEIDKLEEVYRILAEQLINDPQVKEKQVRVRVLGEWPKLLKEETIGVLRKAEEITKDYKERGLTLLVGYNGDREMIDAINTLLKGGVKEVTDESLKSSLWTRDLPPVDLTIRTGGEPHLSAGFMMWDVRYSQLYFTEKYWPDFGKQDLEEAVNYYNSKERRMGK